MTRARLVVALIGLVVVVGAGALVWLDADHSSIARLRVANPYRNAAGFMQGDVPVNTPYVYVTYPLCTTGKPVHVTSVEPVRVKDGLTVTDWALSADPDGLSTAGMGVSGTAAALPGFAQEPVSAPRRHPALLAVSVAITTPTAATDGFQVHSDSGSVFVPFGVTECTAPNAQCRRLDNL